jgi:hypothetical protein
LKRLFKDLFERSNFEDDGIPTNPIDSQPFTTHVGRFDWDILLKAKNGGAAAEAKLPAPEHEAAADGGMAQQTEQQVEDPNLVFSCS